MKKKDLHKPIGGLNTDDNPAILPPEDYTDALNIRVSSSDEQHGVGLAETLQGEVEVLIGVSAEFAYYGGAIGADFIYSGYEEVQIGAQVWMKKNWAVDYPGSKVYDDDEDNRDVYGGLYKWDDIMASDFVPEGWRVPTEADIDELLTFLGGIAIAGAKMKAYGTDHWLTPNIGSSDESGFTALPGGMYDTAFELLQQIGNFWIAEESTPLAPLALDATDIGFASFVANWEASEGADGYYLDISTDPAFGSFVAGFNNLDVGDVLLLDITGLSDETIHYYRLRAYNSLGTSSDSNIITVTTLTDYVALYNWYAATNVHGLAPTGWHIPTRAEWVALDTFLGGSWLAGGILKQIGEINWLTPNTDATDDYGFTALPSGIRYDFGGSFDGIGEYTEYIGTGVWPGNLNQRIRHDSAATQGMWWAVQNEYRGNGYSVRCILDGVDPPDPGTMTDFDVNVYTTVKIGTQVWMAENLKVTHYNDGTAIPNITDNTLWGADTAGARCYYNNVAP